MNSWSRASLGDILPLAYGKSLPASKRIFGEVPVYSSAGHTGQHDTALVPGPCIIIGRKGTVGSVYYEARGCFPIDTTFYTTGSTSIDLKFGYYALLNANLPQYSQDSAVPGLNRNRYSVLEILLPPLQEQRAIVGVLGALDDKIATNTKLAASATSLAFYLYEDALRGTENFSRQLDEVAVNKPGKYLAKSTYETGGEYYVYGSNSVMGKHSEYLVEGAFTVLAKIGSYCGNLRWSQRPAWVNNNASAIVAKDSIDPWILGQALLRVDMQEHRAGTGQPYIQMDSLFSSNVTIPNEEVSRQLAPKLKELAEVSTKHLEESESLTQIRDALLPQLISGKLRVKEVEKVLENAL